MGFRDTSSVLFEGSSCVMLLIEPESGAIVDANPAATAFYGYSRAALRERCIFDINDLSPEQVASQMHLCATGQRADFSFPHRLATGEVRYVEVHSDPVQLEGESLLFSVIQDVTARKTAEAGVREREAQLDGFFRSSPAAMYLIDRDYRFLRLNDTMASLHGMTVDTELGRTVREIVPDTFALLEPLYQGVFKSGQAINDLELQLAVPCEPGVVRHFMATYFPVPGEDGSPRLLGAVVMDVTEHKRAEEQRERLLGELNGALEHIKVLRGILPICASCKQIREQDGSWVPIEAYLHQHSEADFSHGICPPCARKLYPEFYCE